MLFKIWKIYVDYNPYSNIPSHEKLFEFQNKVTRPLYLTIR